MWHSENMLFSLHQCINSYRGSLQNDDQYDISGSSIKDTIKTRFLVIPSRLSEKFKNVYNSTTHTCVHVKTVPFLNILFSFGGDSEHAQNVLTSFIEKAKSIDGIPENDLKGSYDVFVLFDNESANHVREKVLKKIQDDFHNLFYSSFQTLTLANIRFINLKIISELFGNREIRYGMPSINFDANIPIIQCEKHTKGRYANPNRKHPPYDAKECGEGTVGKNHKGERFIVEKSKNNRFYWVKQSEIAPSNVQKTTHVREYCTT